MLFKFLVIITVPISTVSPYTEVKVVMSFKLFTWPEDGVMRSGQLAIFWDMSTCLSMQGAICRKLTSHFMETP